MKIMNLLRNKLFVSLASVAVAVIVVTVSVLSIMIPSYNDWKVGYDAAMKDREHQKYLQTLPLELVGISAELYDGVTYYANGRAAPANGDFNVTAHFTEKGKEFDEILQPTAFELRVPDNFAAIGGTITVSYTFTPKAADEEAETPEPVVKTADVACKLEKVVPVAAMLNEQPYRVTYSDDMAFEPDGMTATVRFNDGSAEEAGIGELTAETGKLAAGTESVTVKWTRGGTEIPFDVPVTVVKAADYKDGEVISLRPEGTTYIAEGALTSEAKPIIRAAYDNGNRLLLREDQYTVSGNTEKASYTKKCLLSVFLKNNPAIFSRTAAIVRSGIEAESATLTGAESETVEEFAYDGGGVLTSLGNIAAVALRSGAKMSFSLTSDAVAKPDLFMRLAVKADNAAGSVALAEVMTMTVNGRKVTVPAASLAPAGEDGKLVFSEVRLPAAVLNKSAANGVEFAFAGKDAARLVVDRITLESGYKGEFYASTEDYLVANAAAGVTVPFNNEIVKSFGRVGGKPYGHSICSDGTYLYIAATTYSEGLRALSVQKYDPVTNTEVAVSAETEVAAKEECAGITYYDDKIIVYFMDGRRMYVDVKDFGNGCVFTEYDGFAFEGLETAVLKDVYYNSAQQRFAVFTGNNIYLYDKTMKKISDFAVEKASGTAKRMVGSADYIYVSYTQNGQYSPVVRVYDWNGKSRGGLTIPVSAEFMTAIGVINTAKTNIQGMAVINGDFYAVLLKFDGSAGGDSSAYVKITMPGISETLEPDLTFGEYLTACGDAAVTPEFKAAPTTGRYGAIDKTSGYAMGGASDGRYLYFASNRNANKSTVIDMVDPANYQIKASSAAFNVAAAVSTSDNSRLFVKDGKLYCVAGDVFSIPLNMFESNCKIEKDEAMTALLTGGERVLKGAYWNAAREKYAVLTQQGKLIVLDKDGTPIVDEVTLGYAGMSVSSLYGDENNIYVSYKINLQESLPIDVYTWSGEKAQTVQITGINLGTYNKPITNPEPDGPTTAVTKNNYNVQAIYTHNGQLHASVCSWSGSESPSVFYDWTVTPDLSVFRSWRQLTDDSPLSDYLTACREEVTAPAFTVAPTTGELGAIEKTSGYAMGGASDGTYLYLANNKGGNASTVISKVDPATYSVVAQSTAFNVAESVKSSDNSRLFIKDGTLYCVAGEVFSILLSEFTQNCVLTKDEAMTTLLSGGTLTLKSAYWNAEAEKFAVMTQQGGLRIIDKDGTPAGEEIALGYAGHSASSVYGDGRYIYVSYKNNFQTVLPIDVYTWDGAKVQTLSVSGINLGYTATEGTTLRNYNVQAVYTHNGKLHASLCTWSGTGQVAAVYYDWTITPDLTVFTA